MKKDIDSKTKNLEVFVKNLNGVEGKFNTRYWWDDELTLDTGWFTSNNKDGTMFHEISHGQGTHDNKDKNDFLNAHLLESLMYVDVEKLLIYSSPKATVDRNCFH